MIKLDIIFLFLSCCHFYDKGSKFALCEDNLYLGWPDCFNSGVFVFKPSLETYTNIMKFASETGSFDGGDQVN